MVLPGVNSVIVPPPSVVVVVEVVVSETWAHANGAAAATAMLSSSFFIFWLSCLICERAHYAPRKRSWPDALIHKNIATIPIGGCVSRKTKNHISLNKIALVPVLATFRFPSRLAGGILTNGTSHRRRDRGVASHLH